MHIVELDKFVTEDEKSSVFNSKNQTNIKTLSVTVKSLFSPAYLSLSSWSPVLSSLVCLLREGSTRLVKSMSTYSVLSSAPWMTNFPVDDEAVSLKSSSRYISPS